MKFFKPPKYKLQAFLLSMPLIDVVLNLVMYKERFWTDISVWLISFPLIFVIGTCSWYAHAVDEDFIERKYPELDQSAIATSDSNAKLKEMISFIKKMIFTDHQI